MHPAFSVLLFTTLSGAGYGLLFWLGLLVAFGQVGRNPTLVLSALAIAFVLVSAGLLASLAHLGRPERAWRAMSQWRSSWLSREGVVAVFTFVPMAGMAAMVLWSAPRSWQAAAAIASCAMAVLTVFCTSRIYDSLKPIPAWYNAWVLPNYLLLAAASGAAWLWSIGVLGFALPGHRGDVVILVGLLVVAALLKWLYWRHIDRARPRVGAASALGLAAGSHIRPFEAPHTQANFLLKEMGFALARKHGRRLRLISMVLLAGLPTLILLPSQWWPQLRAPAAVVLLPSVMLALLIERWLFFAQARHTVMTYYDGGPS